jgi:hypothetical protein
MLCVMVLEQVLAVDLQEALKNKCGALGIAGSGSCRSTSTTSVHGGLQLSQMFVGSQYTQHDHQLSARSETA